MWLLWLALLFIYLFGLIVEGCIALLMLLTMDDYLHRRDLIWALLWPIVILPAIPGWIRKWRERGQEKMVAPEPDKPFIRRWS